MEKTISLGHSKLIPTQVEEIQGLNGSISIPERILQKIWLHQDFSHNTFICYSKKKLQVIHPGIWNGCEGPDFKDAEIILDGKKLVGDIEIHFHPNDWFNHGHAHNPNFSNVLLHVTLFEPNPQHPPVFNALGFCPDTFVLLPYLRQSLEEYVLEDVLLNFENRSNSEFLQAYLNKPAEDLKYLFFENALFRWKQKYAFALARLKLDSWDNVCHQMFLEVLGFRRNRSPMNTIALQYPLKFMIDSLPCAEELYLSQKSKWKLAKVRPSNHPLKRLSQYLHLIKNNPTWPSTWKAFSAQLPQESGIESTSLYRKNHNLSQIHSHIKNSILAQSISGTRLNTLIIDALLPLASALLNKDLFHLWFHWFPGDIPSKISSFLDPSQFFSKSQPGCNGINQAILQLFIQNHLL